MPRKSLTFDEIAAMALENFAGVEKTVYWGSPALKVRGNMMAVIPTNKAAEKDSLAVSCDFERRAELIEGAPEIFYIKDHYLNYPVVLVRLGRIDRDAMRDLLGGAWRFASAKKPTKKR